ncbi:MAG: Septum site-determining protein MinD [Lentisphaerae bacterium ADurb.Bin242]|nr:MAG: Septum site-determining protein MinD [Lentisphaerae bacterium ADurb.Bin242]
MSTCSGNCSACKEKGFCSNENAKLNSVLEKIRHKVMVLSGKGGVGKSSVAASLAVLLARAGKSVGLLDLDFHGPSQPTLFGVQHLRLEGDENGLLPMESKGVKLVSIGLLLDDADQAVIWRGPAKIGILKQLIEEVQWGDLDYLILDFPPGSGDEVLSAAQMITGDRRALVVTTPQELSMADCRKCIDFCRKLEIPLAGIVENMSGFTCPDCGHTHPLFSKGGGALLAKAYGVPLLAQLPLNPRFMERCDNGELDIALKEAPEICNGLENVISTIIQ